jgi:hypothetical protein
MKSEKNEVRSWPTVQNGDAALNVIKAILRAGGRVMSKDEIIDFIQRPMLLGKPQEDSSRRGPKSRKSQYDRAYERRKGLYHKLVRLPVKRREIGENLRNRIRKIAGEKRSCGVGNRQLTSVVLRELELQGLTPNRTTVMRALKAMHFLK